MANFLRLDDRLLGIAALSSPPLEQDGPTALAAGLAQLTVAEKDRLLTHVVRGDALRTRAQLMRHLRPEQTPNGDRSPRRTVATLLDEAGRHRG